MRALARSWLRASHEPGKPTPEKLVALILVVIVSIACGPQAMAPARVSDDPHADWQWVGTSVTLVGRMVNVAFYRSRSPTWRAQPAAVRLEANCATCAQPQRMMIDLTSQASSDLDPGLEGIAAQVAFPAEGRWVFAPLRGELIVRSPTSTEPPVVVLTKGTAPPERGCGIKEISEAVAKFARAFNEGDADGLTSALTDPTDFSLTQQPLEKFVATSRGAVIDYARSRSSMGDGLFPYLVQAGPHAAGYVDLAIYSARRAVDLPGSAGYKRMLAGSRLACADLRLIRFNAGLLSD